MLPFSDPFHFFLCLLLLFKDVKVLYKQLAGSQLEELDVPLGSGLDNILEKIRIHWERDIEKNRAEAGALLRTKVSTDASVHKWLQRLEIWSKPKICPALCNNFKGWFLVLVLLFGNGTAGITGICGRF